MEPKVSVIIPVYNLEDYIDVSVASVLQQTYRNIELILVNDGSKDNSLDKCKLWAEKDDRVVVISQENAGVSAARNVGLDAVTGDYVMFVDGDDLLEKNAISTLFSMFDDPDVVLSVGAMAKITDYQYSFKQLNQPISYEDTILRLQKLLLEQVDMGACSKLYKSEYLLTIRFEKGRAINEDKFFLFRYLLLSRGKVAVTTDEIYGYYFRETSVTNEVFKPKYLDAVYFSEQIIESLKEHNPQLIPYGIYNLMASRLMVLKKIVRTKSFRKNKKVFSKIRRDIISAGLPKDITIRSVKKQEYVALLIHSYIYIMFVKLFDRKKR